jgi:hypothetical protein
MVLEKDASTAHPIRTMGAPNAHQDSSVFEV